jgi:hypothetical protein
MTDKKLTPTEYELLTKTIYEGLLQADGVENIEVKHNQKIIGKSGAKHQIDVYWEHRIAGKTYRTLIECKHYRKKISIGRIRDFYGVLSDIGANGIFVTKVDYQSGAKKFANHYGIDLKLIRETSEADLEGRIRQIKVNVIARTVANNPPLEIKNLKFKKKEDIDWLNEPGTNRNLSFIQPMADVFSSIGTPLNKKFGVLLNEKIPTLDKKMGGPYEEILKFQDEALFYQGRYIELSELNVSYHVDEYSQTSVSEDALAIYTHILRDANNSTIEYLRHRDGGGKKGE